MILCYRFKYVYITFKISSTSTSYNIKVLFNDISSVIMEPNGFADDSFVLLLK